MANISDIFECLAGFKEESVISRLCQEDIDDNSELWLIRMPSNVEVADIDRKKIFLPMKSDLSTITTESGKILDCFVEKCEIPNLRLVLPSKTDGALKEVKQTFRGAILISDGLNLKDNTVIKDELLENAITDSCSSQSSDKKSKKKKKRSFANDKDLNYETDDATNVISKKKHSYKSSQLSHRSGNIEIKSEPDSDEFPNCDSQI